MTTILKAADAREFLALVPHLLTYSPVRSVVLVPFEGNRTLGAMRLDLPSCEDADEIDRVAATFVGMVCKVSRADAVAPVIYTDRTLAGAEALPHDDLIGALLARADLCGLRIVDALCVAPDGWGSYLDPSWPPGGRALAELAVDEQLLSGIPAAVGDQGSGAALPRADLAEKERVARALLSLERAVGLLRDGEPTSPAADDDAGIDPRALSAACGLDDVPGLFEDALGWDADRLDPFDAAALAWCLARPMLRDVALVQWCGDMADGDEALDAQVRWHDGEEIPDHIGGRMVGEGPQPDPERLAGALTLTRHVAATAPRATRPGALATCAWLAWALGRSTHAASYAQAALEIDPEHGLSQIVLTLVANSQLPEWAFERPSR